MKHIFFKNGLSRVCRFARDKKVIFSFVSSVLLIFLTYFANNAPLFTGESMTQYAVIQKICEKFGIHKTVSYGDALFYNVSYDKMLITATRDENRRDTIGVRAVTDREKLLRFLRLLEKSDKYKYVVLDIVFDENDVSVYDDSLFHQISRMRDIVVANHSLINFADSNLIETGKTGLVTYFTTSVTTNFGRFEFKQKDHNSLPLEVYEHLHPDNHMKRYGFGRLSFYKLGGKLCQNASFLTFDDSFSVPVNEILNEKQRALSSNYINLGSFIDDSTYSEALLLRLVKTNTDDKFVVIGDFVEDIHDTYMGAIPGSVIVMRALATLEEGGNLVYVLQIIIWLLIFLLINLSICYNKPLSKRIPLIRNIKYKWFHFLFSIVSFSAILTIISTIEYICGYPVSSLVIPVLYFSLLKLFVQFNAYI